MGAGKLFEIHPTVGLTETWTDNFNVSSNRPQQNYRTTLDLGLNLIMNAALTKGFLASSSGLTYDTADSSKGIKVFPTISAGVTQLLSPRLTMTAIESFTRNDDPGQADRFGLRRERQTFTSNTFGVSAAYLIDLLATEAHYNNSIFMSGGTDTVSHVLGASASTRIGPSNTAQAGYEFSYSKTTRSDSDSVNGSSSPDHSTGNTIYGSLSRQISQYSSAGISSSYTIQSANDARIWNVSLFSTYGLPTGLSVSSSVGYSLLSSDNQKNTSGITTNSTLSYRFTRAVVSVGVFQDFRQTGLEGQNFGIVQTTGFTGSFFYTFTPFMTGNIFAGYSTNDFTGVGNNASTPSSNTLTAGAGLNWQILRWLSSSLRYTYTLRSSGSGGSSVSGNGDISENQASLNLSASF